MLKIGVLLGDDIGLEVVPEAVKCMKAAAAKTGMQAEWIDLPIGKLGHEQHGDASPKITLETLKTCDGWICGPIGHNAYPRNDPTWVMPALFAFSAIRLPTIAAAALLPPFANALRTSASTLDALASTLSPLAEITWA